MMRHCCRSFLAIFTCDLLYGAPHGGHSYLALSGLVHLLIDVWEVLHVVILARTAFVICGQWLGSQMILLIKRPLILLLQCILSEPGVVSNRARHDDLHLLVVEPGRSLGHHALRLLLRWLGARHVRLIPQNHVSRHITA